MWTLIRASHPEPAAVVTVVAVLLAAGVGHRPSGMVLVGATVLSSQLAIGWLNDWLDADRDAAVGRTDKPVARGAIGRRTVAVAGMIAAVLTVPVALPTGLPATAVAMTGLVSALLYDWPLKFTPASVLPYVVSFASLPAFVTLALPGGRNPPVWLLLAGGLLGGGAHFANALPDLADDNRTGVRGLPQRLGATGSTVAAAGLLLAATVALVVGPPGAPSWLGLAAIATAVVVLPIGWYVGHAAARVGGRPVAVFRAVMLVALVDVVLLIGSGQAG